MEKEKMDKSLTEVLEKASPEEELWVIVGFHKEPTDEQMKLLGSDGMEITHDYRGFLDAVAGKIQAKYIDKISEYDFVKDLELSGDARL